MSANNLIPMPDVPMPLTFTVRGIPQTQGSMRAFIPKNGKFPVVTHNKKEALASWRNLIAAEATRCAPTLLWLGPVGMEIMFRLQRPKGHYKKDGVTLRNTAPKLPDGKKYDLDKLQRAVLDALTEIFYRDDGQVCHIVARKEFGPAGVYVAAWEIRR